MFKKTLLALTVAGVASVANAGTVSLGSSTGTSSSVVANATVCDGAGTANAGTICMSAETVIIGQASRTTPVDFDFQSTVDYHNSDASAALFQYDPEATVPVGARVTFTMANAFFIDGDFNLVNAAGAIVASLANEVEDADGNVTAIELTVGTALASGTTYTLVNAGSAGAPAVTAAADTIAINFADGLTGGDEITIGATARDNLGNISAAAASAIPVIMLEKQFVLDTAGFAADNAVVDVDTQRVDFDTADAADTTGGRVGFESVSTSNATLAITDNVGNLEVAIAAAGVTVAHTVTDTGAFAGLNHSETDTTDFTNTTTSQIDGDDLVVDEDDMTVATAASADGDLAYDLALEINGDDAQIERTVSVSTELDYTASATAFATETFNFGAVTTFTLNGANFEVPYLPFGDNTQVIFRITNTSTQTGDLTIRYIVEGSQPTWKDLGVVGAMAPGMTDVSKLIIDAVKADAGITKGKVALDVTVNAPDGSITGFVGFKVLSEEDRGIVGTFQ